MGDDEASENEWSDFDPGIAMFSSQRPVEASAGAPGKERDDSEDENGTDSEHGDEMEIDGQDDSSSDREKDSRPEDDSSEDGSERGSEDGNEDASSDAEHEEKITTKDESQITDEQENSESEDDDDDDAENEKGTAVNGHGRLSPGPMVVSKSDDDDSDITEHDQGIAVNGHHGQLSDGTMKSISKGKSIGARAGKGHALPSVPEPVEGNESDEESEMSGDDESDAGSRNLGHDDIPATRRTMATDNDVPLTPPSMLRMAEKRKRQDQQSKSRSHKLKRVVSNGTPHRATEDPYRYPPSSNEQSSPSLESSSLLESSPTRQRSTPGSSKRKQRAKPPFSESQSASKGKEPEKPASTVNRSFARLFSSQPSSSKASQSSSAQPSSTQSSPLKRSFSNASSSQPLPTQPSSARQSSTRPRASGSRTRIFTTDEIGRITAAVEKYRDDHNMTQTEVNELIQKDLGIGRTALSPETARFWALITATCPDKQRQKVIDFCRMRFHNFKARGGHWTPEEDERLAQLVAQGGTKWAKWSQIMNRHPRDLRDRYRNYIICGSNRASDRWSREEEEMLQMHVREAIEAIERAKADKPGDAFYDRPSEQLVDWQLISSRLDRTRSRLQCIRKWKQLEARASST